MTKRIHQYALPLSLIAALAALAAAPFLIPENPDSAIFRSGTLGTLLILACSFPVRQAYEKVSLRTLSVSMLLGLFFAAALSLGSELFIYNGLLPGMGSMLRRVAVPFMAAPLFGGLCARMMMAPPIAAKRPLRIPLAAYMAILLVCWLPALLAYWPGMLNYDFVGEYAQHTSGSYSSIHPLLHSAVMNGIIAIGTAIHSETLGLLLMSILQMALFAAALAYACVFAQKRGASPWLLAAMTALFALHPVFSVMSISMTKDTLFAAGALVLSLETYALIESPAAFLRSRLRCAGYAVLTVCTALMRNNGVFALALLFPAALAVLRGFRRQALLLFGASACAALITLGGLHLALKPASLPSFQLYSLPAQQLVRAYNSGKLDEAEKAEIAEWYVSEEGLRVHPHLADPAKGYLDKPRLEEEGGRFLAIWKRHAGACAMEYTEALLMLNVGSWYPDDLSHSTIYPDVSWNDKGYLQTHEYDMQAEGFETRCFLPKVKALFERICRRNQYQKYPLVSILFCTATPFWVLLFAASVMITRRQARYLPAALGALGLWLSYLFGPCTLPRYTLPLFCLAPVLLALALRMPEKPISE